MIQYILIPGRHHAVTQFQINYLRQALQQGSIALLDGTEALLHPRAKVIWAITSGNHSNTRRNPISGVRRVAMVEAAAGSLPSQSEAYLIPNTNPKKDFAHYLVEEIHIQSRGRLSLMPANCIVACSTPNVIAQYQERDFAIAPVELTKLEPTEYAARRPWDVIEELIRSGSEWRSNSIVQTELHEACLDHYERYCLGDLIVETHADPLLASDGDITTTRDYTTYRAAFETNAFRKVEQFDNYVMPGRILDIGCATGETIKLLSQKPTLFESDFYGVEVARPLFEICEQRKSNGEFGNANVFFYQRNIMRSAMFTSNSLDTIITMALTHEIESYLGRNALLEFLARVYDMTSRGGVYINSDVAAPHRKDEQVYVQFTDTDGENPENIFPDIHAAELPAFLTSLSTKARFTRFMHDFRREEGDQITFGEEIVDGQPYIVLRYADLCDFLAKKDYVNSWHSEMHERFCFWNFDDWVHALKQVGFEVSEESKPIQNPWLIENRFAPAAKVLHKDDKGQLAPMPQPETNVLLIAKKPE